MLFVYFDIFFFLFFSFCLCGCVSNFLLLFCFILFFYDAMIPLFLNGPTRLK